MPRDAIENLNETKQNPSKYDVKVAKPPMIPNIIHKIDVNFADFVVKLADADFLFLYSCLNINKLMMKLMNPNMHHGSHSKSDQCSDMIEDSSKNFRVITPACQL